MSPSIKVFIFVVVYVIIIHALLVSSCQVIPQAICARYGLAVGANFIWLVQVMLVICYPISYPFGKVFHHQKVEKFHFFFLLYLRLAKSHLDDLK